MALVEAKLVGLTQPVKDCPANTPEELIAFCARVSSERDYDKRGEDFKGLINYCIKNKHWSIFEMVNVVVEVTAPRDITRQLLRHRSFSFQELSQRYSSDIEYTTREMRLQDPKNRQNSIHENNPTFFGGSVSKYLNTIYRQILEMGCAKECARVVLPEGLTLSTMYVNGTLRSWLHYLDVRDDPGVTQHEHVLLAKEIRKVIEPVFPTIFPKKDFGVGSFSIYKV